MVFKPIPPKLAQRIIDGLTEPTRRVLQGEEKAAILQLLQSVKPTSAFDNQRVYTKQYRLGNKMFEITISADTYDPIVEELIY